MMTKTWRGVLVGLVLSFLAGGAVSGQIVISSLTSGTPTAPAAVTQAATGVTNTTATLQGTGDPNSVPTNGFFVWGTTSSFGSSTATQALGSGPTPVSIAGGGLTGLACETTYLFQATATSAGGTNAGNTVSFTTSACGFAPTPPTVVTTAATNVTPTSAILTGTANPHSTTTTGQFEWGLTAGYGTTTALQAIGAGASALAIGGGTLPGLTCATLYHFRATATNGGGTTTGSDATVTTSACPITPPTVTSAPG